MEIKDQKTYTFFDESGTDGKSKFLALGLIKIKDIVSFHKALEGVRYHHHFKNEIKFEKASNLRAAIAKEWIEIFFGFPAAKFHCLVVEKQKAEIPLINLKRWPRFKLYTKMFLDKYLEEVNTHFYFDSYSKAQDRKFEEYLLTHIKGLESIEGVDSKDYDALQMCDLLLGAVRSDFEEVISSSHKKEIIGCIQTKLNTRRVAEPLDKKQFSVTILAGRDFKN